MREGETTKGVDSSTLKLTIFQVITLVEVGWNIGTLTALFRISRCQPFFVHSVKTFVEVQIRVLEVAGVKDRCPNRGRETFLILFPVVALFATLAFSWWDDTDAIKKFFKKNASKLGHLKMSWWFVSLFFFSNRVKWFTYWVWTVNLLVICGTFMRGWIF